MKLMASTALSDHLLRGHAPPPPPHPPVTVAYAACSVLDHLSSHGFVVLAPRDPPPSNDYSLMCGLGEQRFSLCDYELVRRPRRRRPRPPPPAPAGPPGQQRLRQWQNLVKARIWPRLLRLRATSSFGPLPAPAVASLVGGGSKEGHHPAQSSLLLNPPPISS